MPGCGGRAAGVAAVPLVLAADVLEIPSGVRLSARSSDISRTGCYIDTLNPIPRGSLVRLRTTDSQEVFEAVATAVYVSHGLGMGVRFTEVTPEEQKKQDGWLEDPNKEF